MNKALLAWLAILFVFAGGALCWFAVNRLAARDAEPLVVPKDVAIGKFELTERSGRTFHSKELAGQVWVASFFFAECMQSCHQQNLVVQSLHRDYAKQGIKFVSITVDPAKDTPQRLSEYARQFRAGEESWLFLTGEMTHIRRIGVETFQLFIDEKTHADRLVLVDKEGEIRGVFNWHDEKEMNTLRRMMVELLAEVPPGAGTDVPDPA